MQITISDTIRNLCPKIELAIIECEVRNSETSEKLWDEMNKNISVVKSNYKIEEINKREEILNTRNAYKKTGKDPNRYRPSAEALSRRIVRDLPIYRVNTLVDIINIVSIRSGFSIGAFDKSKINWDLSLDVGKFDDEFEAIGRGNLNIEGLPVLRDNSGAIGSPTSDSERTKIEIKTEKMLIVIYAFNGNKNLIASIEHCRELLTNYADMSSFDYKIEAS